MTGKNLVSPVQLVRLVVFGYRNDFEAHARLIKN